MHDEAASAAGSRSRSRARIGSGLYAHVVESLGQEIVDGTIAVGSILFVDGLCERFGVSRSVVREAVRTLGSMGLVAPRPQVGTRVQPPSEWDLLNPHIVRWRSLGTAALEQLRELLELRLGLEPVAARLAAARMPQPAADRLVACVAGMEDAYAAGDAHRYFALDVEFHSLLLDGSGNGVMARLAEAVGITIAARSRDPRPGMDGIRQPSIADHRILAEAIAAHDVEAAETAARVVVRDTLAEIDGIRTRATT